MKIKKTLTLINNFWTNVEMTKSRQRSRNRMFGIKENGICQCSIDTCIKSSKDPSSDLSFFFVGSLIYDVMGRFHNISYQFRTTFKFPYLMYHADLGMTCPTWYFKFYKPDDKRLNWDQMKEILEIFILDIHSWFKKNYYENEFERFKTLLLKCIESKLERFHDSIILRNTLKKMEFLPNTLV